MKTLITLLLLLISFSAEAFVLVGTAVNNGNATSGNLENTFDTNGSGGVVAGANLIDDLGTPKRLGEFYRWNTPYLAYGFDDSFVQFFGVAGMNAVNDAMRVLNDFFDPEDGSYSGVSDLNLGRHGFGLNYNTMWLNESAAQERLLDLKSVALGSMVNYLGLGNPYRYAFTATNAYLINPGGSGIIFESTLKNYDPITRMASDEINGVKFSYRLVHDQPPGVLPDAATLAGMTIDMEEFTSDTSGNAYSAVSAIVDAFYGNTEMIWTDIPSLFHFGVYYDGANAMGGMYKPRHALTFDDAGGLKYLYSTNTIAMEFSPYVLVAAADFTYPYSVSRYNLPPSSSPLANRMAGVFPTRNAGGLPTVFSSIHPLSRFGNPYSSPTAVGSMGTFSRDATGFYGVTTGMMDWAWRGGIDKIRFVPLGYDSLLNMSSYSTNFMWTDTFMTNALIEQQIVSPNGTIGLVPEGAQYFQQMVGRDVVAPDFLFRAELLGNTPDGVSVAFERTGSSLGTLTSVATTITEKLATTPDANSSITGQGGPTGANRYNAWQYNVQNGVTFGNPGPGTIVSNPQAGAPSFELIFNKEYSIGGFEVMWNGESSVVGNQLVPVAQQQWAYIWGPGSSDYHVFPDGSFTKIIENTVLPVAGVPEITLVSDDGGRSAIEPNSLTRTTETLTVLGRNFRSATAMEILNSQSAVVQLIYLDANFIKGDDRIEIPAGIIDYESEGVARQVRIWNTLGSSGLSQEKFSIVTGAPIVFATTYDEVAFDRGESLTISGVGFKSMKVRQTQDGNATLTHIQILDSTGQVIFPDENSTGFGKDVAETSQLEVISDTKAILAADTLTRVVDGVNRSLRVSRGSASTLSAVRNSMFSVISAKPKITRFSWMDLVSGEKTDINTSNPLRRDEAIFIEGEGLNTVTSIELTRENGVSFSVPVLARADAISSDLNGSEVRLAKLAFTSAEADGHGLLRARLRVVNAFGAVVWTAAFNVNVQPNDGSQDSGLQVFINGLPTGESQGVSALLWDRSAATGEDITFLGSGLKAVTRISIIENDGSAINPSPELIINPSGTPGITVSDTIIKVDTSLVQFTDINSADATDMTRYLRFKLESARQPVLTTPEVGQRVLVGVPPKFTSYDLNNTDPANDANFRRDAHEMTVHGEGFQLLQYIDILDDEGFPIIPTSSIPVPTPGIDINATGENFKLLGTVLSANGAILDSAEPYSRRLKIKTPWGIVYSDANASGSFSLTADPVVSGSAAAAFAGGGFTGSNTYDINSSVGLWPNNLLPLVINGQNLMSIGNIAFVNNPGDTVYYSFDVNASTPPSGITFSADGTQISIAGIFIWEKSNGWYNSSGQANRRLKLISGAGQEIYTPYLETNPAGNDTGIAPTQITSIGGSGWSSGHFERNGTLVVTGSGLEGVSHVTLTDSTGAEIAPINPLPVDGINVSANATAVSIGADLFNADANLLDSVVSGSRRVKLYFPDASTLMSDANATAGAFTVSRIPTFGVFGVAYAAVGGADGGAATGIYDRAVGNGNLSITSLGIDMKGVTGIQFWDQGDGAKVATTTDLIASDWTVSADGRSLTLTKATIEAKGANWFSPDNDRQLKLTTVAGSSDTTPAISTQEPVLAATPLSGTGLTGNHFKRNAGTLVVSGQYLSGATQVTLVENNGSDVAGVTPLAVDGVNVVATATTITVNPDKFEDNAIDTITALGRRVKIIFPSSSITTPADVNGAFTVSASPNVLQAITFVYAAVGGADGGAASGTYDRTTGNGNLSITAVGADMRGVSKIEFWDNGGGARIAGTTDLASADWTVSADGRSITISKATMEAKGANWYAADTDRQLQLTTVGEVASLTPQVATGSSIFTSIAGITGGHYKRDTDTLVINGTNLGGANFITLVDESGSSIAGVGPITVNGVTVVATSTTITISPDQFADNLSDSDSITTWRKLKVSFPSQDTFTSNFTVSATPNVAGLASVVYAPVGGADGGAATGTYSSLVGDGSISVTTTAAAPAGRDMRGVIKVEFWDQGTGAKVPGTTDLNSSDWAMSADARSITITKAVMDAKGAAWYGNDTDHQLKLTTVSGATGVTPTIITGAPAFVSLGGTGLTGNNYRRDAGTLIINGSDLIGATHVTLVESNGSDIAGVTPLAVDGVDVIATNSDITVGADKFVDGNGSLDSAAALGRRIKITFAGSTLMTDANATGAFTVSATPAFDVVAAAYVGTGDGNAASGTYSSLVGDGSINLTALGADMRAVTLIEFWDQGSSAQVAGTTDLTSSDWTVSADGTKVTITKATMDAKGANWYAADSGRELKITTVSGVNTVSPVIATALPAFTSITGVTTNNYRRDSDTLVINGTDLLGATQVTIVDAAGADIPGLAALAVDGNDVNATNTTVKLGVDKFGDINGSIDTASALQRRLKVTFGNKSTHFVTPAGATGAFTVSATPTVDAADATAYAAVGGIADGGAASGTYSKHAGNGNLSITAVGADMRGIIKVEFWDQGDAAKVAGTTDLTAADWIVSGDGRSITIAKATIEAKGANWYASDTDRQFKLTTVTSGTETTPAIATGQPSFTGFVGITGDHYRRDLDTLLINGTDLSGATQVTLVDAAGIDIPGVTALLTSSPEANATATTIAIGADAFADGNGSLDSLATGGRLVKITFPGTTVTTDANATGAFTVSATPAFGAVAAAYAGAGDGDAASGTYSVLVGDGSLSLTAVGADMRGVKAIEFWDQGANAKVPGTTDLNSSDWTVDATGTKITITKATMDAKGANWYAADDDRLLRLTSASAQTALSPQISTAIPTFVGLAGTGLTGNDYRRDAGTLIINGTDLAGATQVTLVEANGSDIAGVTALLTSNPEATATATTITIGADAFADGNGSLDSIVALGRRVKITFPDARTLISDNNSTGAFTVSANPAFGAVVVAYDAVGGADGGAGGGTYSRNVGNGNLSITSVDADMRGVASIQFWDQGDGAKVGGTTDLLFGDWTTSADGRSITITQAVLDNNGTNWQAADTDRRLQLTMAANTTTLTPIIATGIPTFTSLAGVTGNNYRRDSDTLVINGTDLGGATQVTLVENNGSDVPGVTPLAVDGVNVVATATTITVSSDKFGDNATDTITALGRRVKITFSGSTLTTPNDGTGAFTVSATPTVSAATATAYAAVGGTDGGAAGGTYERNLDNGNLSVTAVGGDMRGVTLIEFWDNGDAAKVVGTTDLTTADWTVSGDGRSLTITKATMDAKGVNWYTTDTDRHLQLTTAGAQTVFTPQITTSNLRITAIGGTGLSVPGHFQRDAGTLTITGIDMDMATQVTLVEANGSDIAGVMALAVDGADVNASSTTITVGVDKFGDNATDTGIASNRRVKITFPTLTMTSPGAPGAFTVSATPVFDSNVSISYAGTGDGNAQSGSYSTDAGDGSITITSIGADMRAVTAIRFYDNGDGNKVAGTTDLVPADWTVGANGRKITITKATVEAKGSQWYVTDSDRQLELTTVSAQTAFSPQITTGPPTFSGFAGITGSDYRRDADTLVINGTDFAAATQVTLVEANGSDIAGVTPLTVDGVNVIATATTITIGADKFGDNATDTTVALGRRVKITFPSPTYLTTDADANGSFTVSATPDVSAALTTIYAAVGGADGGAANGTYTHAANNGNLSITTESGTDMNGVSTIEWMNGGGTKVAGTTDLTTADFTVSDGESITITKGTIAAKGANWMASGNGRYLRLTTAAGQTVDTPNINTRSPAFTGLAGSGYSAGLGAYDRAAGTLIINGTDLALAQSVTLVDFAGTDIPGITVLDVNATDVNATATSITIGADKFSDNQIDTNATDNSRRVKINFADFVIYSSADANGSFTVSAAPTFNASTATTYAGAGSGFGVDMYSPSLLFLSSNGNLNITVDAAASADLRGISAIQFWDISDGAAVVGTTDLNSSTPGQWTVSGDGRKITIDRATINLHGSNWCVGAQTDRCLRLITEYGTAVLTPGISTHNPTFASLNGTGLAAQNYRRDNGTLDFNGTELGFASSIELVTLAGASIGGATPILTSSGDANATATYVTVGAGSPFGDNWIDSNSTPVTGIDRRVQINFNNGPIMSPADATGQISVSATPNVSDTNATIFAYVADGISSTYDGNASTGTYAHGTNVGGAHGGLSITAAGADMRGVASIEWHDISLGGAIAGTTTLTKETVGDWIVSANGRSITIPWSIINTKGANWFALAGGNGDRRFRLYTYGGQQIDTSTLNAQP